LPARRAIDLHADVAGVAKNMLLATGTGKFEFGHKLFAGNAGSDLV
jgi:hypothetical protein